MATRSVVISCGFAVALGRVAWSGTTPARERVPWLPPPNVRVVDPRTGMMDPAWYRAFKELFDNRLGGINGIAVPALNTSVTETQLQATQTSQGLVETLAYARGVGVQAGALAQVAVNNALTGATSVPPPPEPPDPGRWRDD